jgi:peptidoglycan/LPS O-acetylase OafA/YrhL
MHLPLAADATRLTVAPFHQNYRPDIDGLRAIAILFVVGYHAFPHLIPSGFVGVDVFFVLSGFLITSILLSDLAQHRFNLLTFYARRIRRLFPALLVVTTCCLAAGWLLLWPEEFRRLAKLTVAGAVFLTNFALWREANYFDAASDSKILLHLWSLAIEEQFYLIWPALIALTWRLRFGAFFVLGAVFAASFLYGWSTTSTNQVAAFYSPAARVWELAGGAIVARLLLSAPFRDLAGVSARSSRALSLIGLTLIITSAFVITERDKFPGVWALMPVAGTCLATLAGPSAWVNRRLLACPVLIWFGLISYPLYLWHWPLLAFANDVMHHETSPGLRAMLLAAAIGLAWLTYRYVEQPIRSAIPERKAAPVLGAAMLATAALGAVVLIQDGFPARFPDEKSAYALFFDRGSQRTIDEAKLINQLPCNFYSFDSSVPTKAPRTVDPGCYTRHSAKSVLILGDSNGADLYYGLDEALPKDVSLLLLYSSGCRVRAFSEVRIETDHCDMANYFALERIKADPPDVVLMASYNSFDIDYIRGYSALIRSLGVKHVLVLGQRPHWRYDLHRIVLDEFWSYTPHYIPGHLDDELHMLGRQFQSQLRADEPFEFVDQIQPFCNADGCLTYLGDDRRDGLITADTAHLRPAASAWLARRHLAPLIMQHMGR